MLSAMIKDDQMDHAMEGQKIKTLLADHLVIVDGQMQGQLI